MRQILRCKKVSVSVWRIWLPPLPGGVRSANVELLGREHRCLLNHHCKTFDEGWNTRRRGQDSRPLRRRAKRGLAPTRSYVGCSYPPDGTR